MIMSGFLEEASSSSRTAGLRTTTSLKIAYLQPPHVPSSSSLRQLVAVLSRIQGCIEDNLAYATGDNSLISIALGGPGVS
jgi:hypothetical protein